MHVDRVNCIFTHIKKVDQFIYYYKNGTHSSIVSSKCFDTTKNNSPGTIKFIQCLNSYFPFMCDYFSIYDVCKWSYFHMLFNESS